jgi:hypothetical protein
MSPANPLACVVRASRASSPARLATSWSRNRLPPPRAIEERRQVPLELKLEADEKAPRHFAPVAPQPIVLGPALEQKITSVSRAEFPTELVFGPKKGHASAATVKRP